MKTTTVLILLFFSALTAFSQENNCVLSYRLGFNQAYWSDDADQFVCKGGSLKITCLRVANAGYQWKKDGKIIPDANTFTYYATEEGVYTAEVQTVDCKYVSPKITFKYTTQFVNNGFELNYAYGSIKTNELTICDKGESFNVNINYFSSYGEIEYQWQRDGIDIEGTNARNLLINKAGVYTVRARQGECLSHTEPLKINVKKDEKIVNPIRLSSARYSYSLTGGDTLYVCENTTIGLSSVFHFSSKYRWFKDGNQVEEANSQQFIVKESGVYNYEVSLPGGCDAKSEKVVVSFGKKINKPKIQFSKETRGCKFDDVNISDDDFFNNYFESISGEKKMSWYKNSVYQNPYWGLPVYPNESASYKVVVDIGTCSTEDNFKVDSSTPRIVKLRNNQIKDGKIALCEGNAVALGFPTEYSSATYNYKLQWYRDGKPIDTDVFSLRVTDSGRYYATYIALDNACMQYSDTIGVTVTKAPTLQFDKVMLSTCSYWLVTEPKDDVTYAWKKDGKLIAGANKYELFPKESGNYSFVANRGYCFYESGARSVEVLTKSALVEKNIYCENDSLRLKAPEGNSYLWQGPNNFSSQLRNPQIDNINGKNSGLYKVVASIEGCSYKDSVFVTVNEKPEISIERADEYCLGKDIIMIARVHNGYSYWLDPMGNVDKSPVLTIKNATRAHNGVYTATALTYNTGCKTTISTEIKLNEGICKSIDLFQPLKNLCSNVENELTFNIDGPFSQGEKFNLYYINSSGEKTFLATTNKSPLKFKAIGLMPDRLVIESSVSKVRSNIIAVRYDVISYYISRDFTQVCNGFSVPLRLDSNSYRFDKIQWLKNNVAIDGANRYSYNATESGNYWVRVERNGCKSLDSDSSSRRVAVKIGEISKPYIGTYYATANVCNGYSVPLDMNWYRLINKKYQWQLNDVDIPNAVDSFYLAKQAGDYSLKVTQGTCEAISSKVRVTFNMLSAPIISSFPYGANQNGVTEICDGSEITLSSASYLDYSFKLNDWTPKPIEGVRFQWQKDNLDIPSANNFEYKTKEEGTYRLKVFQGDCMAISATILIKKGKPKSLNLYESWGGDCIGEKKSISVSINSGITSVLGCSIYKDNKFFKEANTNEYFTIEESGNYHANIEFKIPNSATACVLYSDTLKIAFKDKIINYNLASNSSMTTCLDSIPITGMPLDNLYNPKYQWKFNGQVIPNDTTYILMATQSGVYQLETKSSLGCVYESNPIKVEFNKLEIEIDKPDYVCYNKLPYLYPRIKSIDSYYTIDNTYVTKTLGYEWQFEGVNIGRYYGQGVTKSGAYTLIVKQGTCNAKTTANIDIIEIPHNLSPNQDSLFLCPKGIVSFSAQQGNFKYTWLKNNQLFDDNQTQTIKTSSEGTYKVWIEKESCGVMSNAIVVKEKNIPPTATISGNKEIMNGDSTKIKIDFTSLPPWTIKLTNNQEFIANKTPFEFAVKPLQTTVYELASVKNDCGIGTVSGKAEIKIIILGNEELAGAKIKLFPVPTQGICQLSVETVVPEKLGFQLFNVEGKLLMQSEENNSGNSFKEVINLETVPDGVYVLKIKVGNKVVNRKIIKGN